ncbi:hypothetical protein CR513_50822, partial [Mucuna pruriens]
MEIEKRMEWDKPKFQPSVEELESINLGGETEKKEVKVGRLMPPESRSRLIELLKEYADIFAWSYQDMPGLDREIVEHKLPLLPNCIPVRQQLRRMKPEVALKIKEEVEKQWNAGFLAVSKYPQWVANIILMAQEDLEKTTFITLWGTFCYKVMPFGLKNAGATYQRAMVTLFHDMMHKEICG